MRTIWQSCFPWAAGLVLVAALAVGGLSELWFHRPAPPTPAADTIGLPADATVPLDELYELAAKSTTDDIDWEIVPSATLIAKRYEHSCVLHVKTPGSYTVVARIVSGGKIAKCASRITVLGPAPSPQPGPAPLPPQPQPPAPTAKTLYLVVIENTDAVAATRAAYWTDPALLAFLKAKGLKPALASRNTIDPLTGRPPSDLAPYLTDAAAQVAKGKAYPRCYVVDETGRPYYEDDLPATPAGLVGLLKKIGG